MKSSLDLTVGQGSAVSGHARTGHCTMSNQALLGTRGWGSAHDSVISAVHHRHRRPRRHDAVPGCARTPRRRGVGRNVHRARVLRLVRAQRRLRRGTRGSLLAERECGAVALRLCMPVRRAEGIRVEQSRSVAKASETHTHTTV